MSYQELKLYIIIVVIIVQSPSRVWLFVTPWTAAGQASLLFIYCYTVYTIV